jgi:hypothetical protein
LEKIYEIPEQVMIEIIKVINSLPYGQIAPLANALNKIIKSQQEDTTLNNE